MRPRDGSCSHFCCRYEASKMEDSQTMRPKRSVRRSMTDDEIRNFANSDIPSGSEDEKLESDEDECVSSSEMNNNISSSEESDSSAVGSESSESSQPDEPPAKKKRNTQKKKKWEWVEKCPEEHEQPQNELIPSGKACNATTPVKMFKTMFDNELINLLTFESNRYRLIQRPKMRTISTNEMEVFLGICIYMSVVSIPFRRWYWSSSTRQPLVADAMPVNRWEEILSVLHLNDSQLEKKPGELGYDRLQKVRPMITHLNKNFSDVVEPEICQCIDEQMIPFKGRHSLKVYMVKKPCKWGYKVWVRAGQSGFVHEIELFGDNMKTDPINVPPELGESGRIVARLSRSLPAGTYLFFDNFFASPKLLAYLKSIGLYGTCTLRRDRSEHCPLKTEKEMKAEGRGSYDYKVSKDDGILVCEWFDNKLVLVGSNIHSIEPLLQVKRFDRKNKCHIEVDCPALIGVYNKHMGGVDKCDMLLSLYRLHIKTRKWYKRIIFHLMDVATSNAWLLYRRVIPDCSMQYGKFKMNVATALIQAENSDSDSKVVVPKKLPMKASYVNNDVRYDRVGHFPRQAASHAQRCKMEGCKRKSTYMCLKCQVYLCIDLKTECFYHFHNVV